MSQQKIHPTINHNEMFRYSLKYSYLSLFLIPTNYQYHLFTIMLNYRIYWGWWHAWIVYTLYWRNVFIELELKQSVLLTITMNTTKYIHTFVLHIIRCIQRQMFTLLTEYTNCFMFRQSSLQTICQLLTLNFILFMIPSKLFQI